MPTRVFKTAEFAKFAGKAKITDAILVDAIVRVERGLVDADLVGGVVKLRIARPNEGRRGGYRTIVACVVDQRAFFIMGYGKNDMANIEPAELHRYRRLAVVLQSLDEAALDKALANGEAVEIER